MCSGELERSLLESKRSPARGFYTHMPPEIRNICSKADVKQSIKQGKYGLVAFGLRGQKECPRRETKQH